MRVRIRHTPYRDIKRKDRGTVIAKKHVGTRHEVWRVQVGDISRLFYPNELEVLNGRA